jgi:hypothetical protein
MLCLNTYDVVGRILKRLKVRASCLLRFDEGKTFNADSSVLRPRDFIDIVDELRGFGFEFLGGYTDRGICKLVNAYTNVKEWLDEGREALGFINLYWIFLYRDEPPSGLLILTPECLVFVQGVSEPGENMWLRLVGVPKDEEKRMDELASKHELRWWGDPAHPILYRPCRLSLENAKKFWLDTFALLKEAHYSRI